MTTGVYFLLDETGSMASMQDEVITGFNKWLEDLKASDQGYLLTLVKFDTSHYTKVHDRTLIGHVAPLSRETYRPGASTPLYDALGTMLTDARPGEGEGRLCVVFTDGEENASTKWTLEAINALIKSKEADGWTFLYLGLSVDAWKNEEMFVGTMSAANTLRTNSARGTRLSMERMSGQTVAYAVAREAGNLGTQVLVDDQMQVELTAEELAPEATDGADSE